MLRKEKHLKVDQCITFNFSPIDEQDADENSSTLSENSAEGMQNQKPIKTKTSTKSENTEKPNLLDDEL